MRKVTGKEFFEWVEKFEETSPKMLREYLGKNVTLYLGGSGITIKAVTVYMPETLEFMYLVESEFA